MMKKSMFLETTPEELEDIILAVSHAKRLVDSGIILQDITEALQWAKRHVDAKLEQAPVGVIDLMSAKGDAVVLAFFHHDPVSFNGIHDWNVSNVQRTVNETTRKMQLVLLLSRTGSVGMAMVDEKSSLTIDYLG